MGQKNKAKGPKGRAAAKQKAKKGSGSAGFSQYSSPMSRFSKQMLDDEDDDFIGFRGFAQKEGTSAHKSTPFFSRNTAVKLRHQTINFVSAGSNTPQEEQSEFEVEVGEESEEEDDDDEGLDDSIQTNIVSDTGIEVANITMANMHIQSPAAGEGAQAATPHSDANMSGMNSLPQHVMSSDPPLFVVDTVGDPNLVYKSKASGKRPVQRAPSPTPSDSSEEVVIFHGRNQPSSNIKQQHPRSTESGQSGPSPPKPSTPQPAAQDVQRREVQPIGTPQPYVKPSIPPTPEPASQKQTPKQQTPHVTDKLLNALERPTPPPPERPSPFTAMGWGANKPKSDAEVDPDAQWAPAPAGSWWKRGRPRPDLDPHPTEAAAIDHKPRSQTKVAFAEPSTEESVKLTEAKSQKSAATTELTAEESIASLQADWKAVIKDKQQAKQSAREPDEIKLNGSSSRPKRRGKRGRKKDNRSLREPFQEDEDDEDDGEAAYVDYMENLAAQMDADGEDGGLARLNGTSQSAFTFGSSLFVDGEEIADDEVLKSHLDLMGANDDTSSSNSGPIGQDLSDLSSSGLEDELEYTEREQWEDEEDLRQRRRDRMTDEQIARMFAKQQEFGYHGDDLVFEDGQYMSQSEIEGVGDVEGARAGLANISNFSYGRARNKNGMRRGGQQKTTDMFPDASALADSVDQFGNEGFDIMDMDRPSLRPTKRGRKGNLPPEVEALSDEELKDSLRDQWTNDRRKKSLKKTEREELRMQGLLGASGKQGKADLSVKYAGGITMQQVHAELRTFLLDNGQQSRPFPPMGKTDRKALHDIANVLNLKSKSVGMGNDRFPTLYKTQHTPYTPEMVDRAIDLSVKGALARDSRMGRKLAKKNAKTMNKGKGGMGGGTAGASVRHGEVVGAGAAELGKENFGHRLMEKMGWSKGMALGKDGEGRLTPVEQTMRVGKAGLG